MDDSSDSDAADLPPRPEKRPKRARDGEHADNEQNLNSQEFGIMRGSYDPKHGSRFVGSGSGIHFIRTVYGMLAGNSVVPSTSEDTTSPAVPGEDDELSRDRPEPLTGSAKGTAPDTNLWTTDEIILDSHNAQNPEFEDFIAWTKAYFENWHPIFPFIHAPSVLDVFDKVSQSGLGSITAADKTIIRALISMGIADGRQATSRPAPPPAELIFMNVSQLMMDVQFAICQPATLHNLQALFAAQLFLVSMLKFNFASRLGGTVVRMAFHLGLHRCPSRFRNIGTQENQIRRRIFFSIYCLDRILCQSLGLPLGISDTDIDVCYPGEECHVPLPPQLSSVRNEDKHLVTLSMFAQHAKIRGMILELRNKALHSRHETAKRALRIEMELSKWSNLLHEIIDEAADQERDDNVPAGSISPLHRMYLLLLEHESTIALNRPLITANKSSTNAMSALQNCIRASRSIISTLDEYRTRNCPAGRRDACLVTPITWPLVTWCCWMSFFILAFAALEGRSKKQFAVK
ncbi:hypothetical protein, variant [Verruconis gallopava]|nr:hypothetical protein, variant [Verruconis gallopava]KIW06365.1 hypothetical protein, variant [Verruconis gallopava]